VSVCKSCGAQIRWAKTEAGKTIPLDPEPTLNGNVVLDHAGVAHVRHAGVGGARYVSHFATCPFAKQHRRR
jgi:hypothetical protein